MYRYQYELFKKEGIYIAGPECFYSHGAKMLATMRMRAEALGFGVTLPNDHLLDMENQDLQKRADSIFADLRTIMQDTTVVIADLEAYRGAEADAGTVYELGMAYAKGARCYGYTRDKRSLASKNQQAYLKDGNVYDERNQVMPYSFLPFSPAIIGSTKIIEGDYDDCLHMLMTDIEEEYKFCASRKKLVLNNCSVTERCNKRPLIYLSVFERYDPDAEEKISRMKILCDQYGFDAVSPLDPAPGVLKEETDNPYMWAMYQFDNWQQHVRNCDILIANLNDYRGYEVNNDVAFECGMAFELHKKLYGYMENTDSCIHKIPNLGAEKEFRDHTGSNVENFNYPVNLMFASSMKIEEGTLEQILKKLAEDLMG